MDARDQDPLAILTNYHAAIDTCLRRKHIPAVDIPDLRQEVYRQAIQYLETREVQAMSSFLQTIAERVAADYWDKRAIHERAAPRLAEKDLAPSNPEHEHNEAEILRHLEEILAVCDPRSRALVLARFFDNLKLEELAARFDMPRSTAHLQLTQAVAALADEFKRRGITSRMVLPFLEQTHANGGSAEPGRTTDKAESSVSFAAPIAPTVRPPSRRGRVVAQMAASAAFGGLLVYLLMQSAQPLARLSPIFVTVAAHGEPSLPGGIYEQDRPLVCPEVVPAPAPAPPSPAAPPSPTDANINAKNRHLARIIKAAEARGDCETANKLRAQLTGAFAATFAQHGPCLSTP